MPELPEVQTVTLNRPDLRFPFADGFAKRLRGARIDSLTRRAKFLQAELSTGETLLMHLGMSGRFTIESPNHTNQPGEFGLAQNTTPKHDHVIFEMSSGARVIYNDPRRFGFMELFGQGEAIERLAHLGPEPLGNSFNGPVLRAGFKGKKTKIKTALLDQRIVAGLGNIYVCEALHRARLSPLMRLTGHIKDILAEAIKAGGSTLKDFASTEGDLGYFQHSFDVYGREGEPCTACKAPITRIVQGGRSTFYCKPCQSGKQ